MDQITENPAQPANPEQQGAAPDAPVAASPDVNAQGADSAATSKWTAFEIVDGKTVPVADAPAAPTPAGVHLLDRARALEELAKEEAAHLIDEGIQAFKDIEGRTMRVVHRFGQLFKQEV